MHWSKRRRIAPTGQEVTSEQEADESIDKAREALRYTREQRTRSLSLAERIAQIREANHFQEFWNQGLR